MNNVIVSSSDYMKGITKCNILYNDVLDYLKKFKYSDDLKISYDEYGMYFKIMKNNNSIGFQVLVDPNTYEFNMYYYIHGNKNLNNMIKINSVNDIINNIKIIFNDCIWKDTMKEIYDYFASYYFYSDIEVSMGNHVIYIIDNITHNGFYIHYDFKSYATIGYIIKYKCFNNNEINVPDLNSLITIINEKIKLNEHNQIKFYNIIDPKYVDCDMNQNIINNHDESFDTQDTIDDPNDPISHSE